MSTNGAYEYGRLLGNIQRTYVEMFNQIANGFQDALKPTLKLTPEEREQRLERQREAAYRRRIAAERETGLRFVRQQTAIARRQLGLPPEGRSGARDGSDDRG